MGCSSQATSVGSTQEIALSHLAVFAASMFRSLHQDDGLVKELEMIHVTLCIYTFLPLGALG